METSSTVRADTAATRFRSRTRNTAWWAPTVPRRRFDLVSGTNQVEHTFVAADGARHTFSFRWRAYTVTELDAMLREAGFAEVEHFGGLERESLTWDTRLVAITRAGSSP